MHALTLTATRRLAKPQQVVLIQPTKGTVQFTMATKAVAKLRQVVLIL